MLFDKKLSQEVSAYVQTHYEEEPSLSPSGIRYSISIDYRALLAELINNGEETYQEMLFRVIDEKGMTDAQCYKKAHLSRKLFSKIRSEEDYHPSRDTMLALGIALELSLPDLKKFLGKNGCALSKTNKSDIIIAFFVERKIYDIYTINEALETFDCLPLGPRRRIRSYCHKVKEKITADRKKKKK